MMTTTASGLQTHTLGFGPRRAIYVPVTDELNAGRVPGREPDAALIADLERYDLLYRTLCGVLYNFVPTSGHPGGSISSGRIVGALLFALLDYDFADPDERANDLLVYAAGHKAMGLYAMWALRNEVVRAGASQLLPKDERRQLRLEDLLGFRRNPTTDTPLFRKFSSKALDGHPTPTTPGVKIATGASGVGIPAGLGLAMGALDAFGPDDAPHVHLLEGEGGMTPGRVSEALATAATAGLLNAFLHVDWNQASIDSNRVCRDGDQPGDYVQWNPIEMCYLHDWNVYRVDDGRDIRQILAAVELARRHPNDQPTAIVYRTVKGWKYGIEGRASHGAGHKFCSDEYYASLTAMEEACGVSFPRFDGNKAPDNVEKTFWETLLVFRSVIEKEGLGKRLGASIIERGESLKKQGRKLRGGHPDLSPLYGDAIRADRIPDELLLKPGSSATLRAALGDALGYVNRATKGGIFAASADLLGSTSVSNIDKEFPEGFFQARTNAGSRLVACGGICEDCIGAFLAGLSTYGMHIGVGSSYAAFIAALQHVAARLHGIGQQARHEVSGDPQKTFVMVCAHAGLKTGEDGPTHADPQALQLLQENFPKGTAITLTPWEPQELWPLTIAALKARPALLAPFVTRPNETVPDRAALKLPPATEAVKGIYALRTADSSAKPYHGTIVLQESGVAYAFVDYVLPRLDQAGYRMNVYLVTSAELFDLLPAAEQEQRFPAARACEAMGITGFTMATMFRWVCSDQGRAQSLHAFVKGRYSGSGQAEMVLAEAGLDGPSQWAAVQRYAEAFAKKNR
jgi:transketolase